MIKVIILNEGGLLSKEIKLSKTDNVVIIGTKNSSIPLELAHTLFESSARLEYVENGSIAEYAFLLGKIAATEEISSVVTDYEELQELFANKKKKAKNPKTVTYENAPEKREKKKRVKPVEDNGSIPENMSSSSQITSVPRQTKKMRSNMGNKSAYTEIKKSDIEKILSKNDIDTALAEPVLEALKTANDVTLDLLIRTHVAGFCETNNIKNKDLISQVCSVICGYVQKK